MASSVTLAALDGNNLTSVVVSGTGGDMVLVAGVAGRRVRVYRLLAAVSGSTTFTFKSSGSSSNDLGGPVPASSLLLDMSGQPWFTTPVGAGFTLSSSAALVVGGKIDFTQSDLGG